MSSNSSKSCAQIVVLSIYDDPHVVERLSKTVAVERIHDQNKALLDNIRRDFAVIIEKLSIFCEKMPADEIGSALREVTSLADHLAHINRNA